MAEQLAIKTWVDIKQIPSSPSSRPCTGLTPSTPSG